MIKKREYSSMKIHKGEGHLLKFLFVSGYGLDTEQKIINIYSNKIHHSLNLLYESSPFNETTIFTSISKKESYSI